MKIDLVGINVSSYYSLALRYIRAYLLSDPSLFDNVSCRILDFTIETDDLIISDHILRDKPALVGFSTFYWTIDKISRIARILKETLPDILIVVGGPQVSWKPGEILEQYPVFDFVVKGEGEATFQDLVRTLLKGVGTDELHSIEGIAFRANDSIVENKDRAFLLITEDFPSVYIPERGGIETDFAAFSEEGSKIVGVIETYRGCPYSCAYCSWTSKSIRKFPLPWIIRELDYMIGSGVNSVFIADSDFCLCRETFTAVTEYLKKYKGMVGIVSFLHIETLREEDVDLLCSAPITLLEVGLQTTTRNALTTIHRPWNKTLFEERYFQIKNHPNREFAIIVDIIYGLPGDNFIGFTRSIEYALDMLGADCLNCFPLTLLRGSPLYQDYAKYDFRVDPGPAWNVICNNTYSIEDMAKSRDMVLAYIVMYATNSFYRRKFLDKTMYQYNLTQFGILEKIGEWMEINPLWSDSFKSLMDRMNLLDGEGKAFSEESRNHELYQALQVFEYRFAKWIDLEKKLEHYKDANIQV